MKYENGKDLFPKELLDEIQKYAAGKIVYIPVNEKKHSWGELTGYREYLSDRNQNIIQRFIDGESISALADEFCLSIESIKKIVYRRKEKGCMSNIENGITEKFNIVTNDDEKIKEILNEIYLAQTEKGYDPYNQLVGYIVTGDPLYVTSHRNSREKICTIERDDLVRYLLRCCLNDNNI